MSYQSSSWMNSGGGPNNTNPPPVTQNNTGGPVNGPVDEGGGLSVTPQQMQNMGNTNGTLSPYAQQFGRFIGRGGNRESFTARGGVQPFVHDPQRMFARQQQQPPKPGEPPKPDPYQRDPFERTPDPYSGMRGNAALEDNTRQEQPSADEFMRQPPWVRPQFGGP